MMFGEKNGGGYVMATGIAEVHLFCVQIRIFVIILKAVSNLVPKKSPFKMSLLRHTCAYDQLELLTGQY